MTPKCQYWAVIELKAKSGRKKSEFIAFTFETQLCPQCSGFLRDWLTVPLPPALLSGLNSTRTSSLS